MKTAASAMGFVDGAIRVLGATPWLAVLVFTAGSLLLVWALDRMADHGLEGTALGMIAMPFCSGLGNLVFVALVARDGSDGGEVIVNALVNNVTNLTLLLGLPALVWGLPLLPGKRRSAKAVRASRINRLSLLLSLAAAGFFAGLLWLLGGDGVLSRSDGAVLVAVFLFWQCFQTFDLLKTKVVQNRRLHSALVVDAGLMLLAGAAIYLSIEGLLAWLGQFGDEALGGHGLGWISGWVMVLPNALLALHYGRRGQADVVYSSQLGDAHICIPLCVGLIAIVQPVVMPAFFVLGLALIGAATIVHAMVLIARGALPRCLGVALAGAYGVFLALGLG